MDVKTETMIPIVLTGHALKSLRDSGHNLPTAIGEVVDNSIEANANHIQIRLDQKRDRRGKIRIRRIAVADDGEGMTSNTLQHYPQIGFSTRYMSTKNIGKYGVGAKLAALSFGQRMDIWSRTKGSESWLHVYFELEETLEKESMGESVGIKPPDDEPVPDDLVELLPSGPGTLVMWSKVDKLEEGRQASDFNSQRQEVEKELSRMFRYFLNGGIVLTVNGTKLYPHDPLYLMDDTWADSQLRNYYSKDKVGKSLAEEIGLKWSTVPTHFPAELLADELITIPTKGLGVTSKARLRVSLYPKELIRKRGMGGDPLAKRVRLPENGGRISFVRLNREINYTSVPRIFPRRVEDPDRFIGIEVSFDPVLDDFFGVRNVKRGVEPHEELRTEIKKVLRRYIPQARNRLEDLWGEAVRVSQDHEGEHSSIVTEVDRVNRTLPKSRVRGPDTEEEGRQILEDLATDVGKNEEQERLEYIGRIQDLPFVIESVNFPGTNFIDIEHLSRQTIIRLNTRHRFYREMWSPIREIAYATSGTVSETQAIQVARRTIEALTLCIIAYAKSESMHEEPATEYKDLRTYWGHFLDTLLHRIKDIV